MTDLPSAAQAMSAAWRLIADDACSMIGIERARLAFDIAKELRSEQIRREFEAPRAPMPFAPPAGNDATQQFTIEWAPGDKADCRHCHTPIVFEESDSYDPRGTDGPLRKWSHKYTRQSVCAVPAMSRTDDAEPTHTFAEPAAR